MKCVWKQTGVQDTRRRRSHRYLHECVQCGRQVWAVPGKIEPHRCGPASTPVPLPLPETPGKGLGDTVANLTSLFGVKPCVPCKERQKRLNALVPYSRRKWRSRWRRLLKWFRRKPARLASVEVPTTLEPLPPPRIQVRIIPKDALESDVPYVDLSLHSHPQP